MRPMSSRMAVIFTARSSSVRNSLFAMPSAASPISMLATRGCGIPFRLPPLEDKGRDGESRTEAKILSVHQDGFMCPGHERGSQRIELGFDGLERLLHGGDGGVEGGGVVQGSGLDGEDDGVDAREEGGVVGWGGGQGWGVEGAAAGGAGGRGVHGGVVCWVDWWEEVVMRMQRQQQVEGCECVVVAKVARIRLWDAVGRKEGGREV